MHLVSTSRTPTLAPHTHTHAPTALFALTHSLLNAPLSHILTSHSHTHALNSSHTPSLSSPSSLALSLLLSLAPSLLSCTLTWWAFLIRTPSHFWPSTL